MPLHKYNNPGLVYYKALSKYLELVKDIPEVVEVRLSSDDQLYAILSATPFDDGPRYRVYRAEGQVMDTVEGQPYRFRLLNDQDSGIEDRVAYNRTHGDLVWACDTGTSQLMEEPVKTNKLNNPGLIYYQALSKYLELVKEIPEVVEVRLAEDDSLCTIISATPHDDEPCYRVFAAQETVMRSLKQQPFLYDLVNCRELPEGAGERLSSLGDLVWQRDS
ncbi:MAG: hypothetical protein F4X66_06645 [Chloroflexi bacterium]|nr:hypothetical protein [Chloroflexota bacterium]MYE40409.1 hypothetical protein [Chloroflexota bacterium]